MTPNKTMYDRKNIKCMNGFPVGSTLMGIFYPVDGCHFTRY